MWQIGGHSRYLSLIHILGEKSAENIIKGIEQSKEVPFERVLIALGIRFVGETVAKKVAKSFKSMAALAEDVYKRQGVGNPSLGDGDLLRELVYKILH